MVCSDLISFTTIPNDLPTYSLYGVTFAQPINSDWMNLRETKCNEHCFSQVTLLNILYFFLPHTSRKAARWVNLSRLKFLNETLLTDSRWNFHLILCFLPALTWAVGWCHRLVFTNTSDCADRRWFESISDIACVIDCLVFQGQSHFCPAIFYDRNLFTAIIWK